MCSSSSNTPGVVTNPLSLVQISSRWCKRPTVLWAPPAPWWCPELSIPHTVASTVGEVVEEAEAEPYKPIATTCITQWHPSRSSCTSYINVHWSRTAGPASSTEEGGICAGIFPGRAEPRLPPADTRRGTFQPHDKEVANSIPSEEGSRRREWESGSRSIKMEGGGS